MSKLVWTKEKPTEPGTYFYRHPGQKSWQVGVWSAEALSGLVRELEFAGPIPQPAEPFDETVTEKDIGTEVEVSEYADFNWVSRKLVGLIEHKRKFVCEIEGFDLVAGWAYARRIREQP